MYCETGKDPFCQQGLLIASQTTTKNGIIEFCWPEEAKACFFFPPSFFFLLFFFSFFSLPGKCINLLTSMRVKSKRKLLNHLPVRGMANFTYNFAIGFSSKFTPKTWVIHFDYFMTLCACALMPNSDHDHVSSCKFFFLSRFQTAGL